MSGRELGTNRCNSTQFEKNLLLFLDPFGEQCEKRIYRYPRPSILRYLMYAMSSRIRANRFKMRKVLFINEGLQSCFFDARHARCYRVLSKRHRPKPRGLRGKIVSLLPLSWRAQDRFIIEIPNDRKAEPNLQEIGESRNFDLMFFHNASGKLLLANGDTILTGSGQLLKTTANPDYAKVMQKEYVMIENISRRLGKPGHLPMNEGRFVANGREFFTEEYIHGRNLRCVFNELAEKKDYGQACKLIDHLDQWYLTYLSAFSGEKRPLSSYYFPVIEMFSARYSTEKNIRGILDSLTRFLDQIDQKHHGVSPVISHNDLWPGNFIERAEGLTAIDWERATEDHAPIFDYYWLIISAALEYIVGRISVVDYSKAFRLFLGKEDPVCEHAHEKLKSFLTSIQLDRDNHAQFLLLFLMEWSIQGYQTLGEVTLMDKLAFIELNDYWRSLHLKTNKYRYL